MKNKLMVPRIAKRRRDGKRNWHITCRGIRSVELWTLKTDYFFICPLVLRAERNRGKHCDFQWFYMLFEAPRSAFGSKSEINRRSLIRIQDSGFWSKIMESQSRILDSARFRLWNLGFRSGVEISRIYNDFTWFCDPRGSLFDLNRSRIEDSLFKSKILDSNPGFWILNPGFWIRLDSDSEILDSGHVAK